MSKKKIIFSLVVTSFSIVFYGIVNFANASSVVEVCRLDAKIINVTEEHVFVDVTGIKICNKSSALCADINKNSDYKITRDNFLKNSYSESIFVGQNIIIDGVSGNAMGPDGPVYWDSWELESAGGKTIKLPITLEKMSVNVTVDDTDSLIEGQTYTVAELNKNTSTTPRKFLTEAYVIYVYKQLPCPPGTEGICEPPTPPYIIISDENKRSSYTQSDTDASVRLGSYSVDSFKLGSKYRFETSISSSKQIDGTSRNGFILVSVKNIDGGAVVSDTTTPPITDQPAKRSLLGRIWGWFAGLFKR